MSNLIDEMFRAVERVGEAVRDAERAARERDAQLADELRTRRLQAARDAATPAAANARASKRASPPEAVRASNGDGDMRPAGGASREPASLPRAPIAGAFAFADRDRLLGAVVMSEILAPPVSLR